MDSAWCVTTPSVSAWLLDVEGDIFGSGSSSGGGGGAVFDVFMALCDTVPSDSSEPLSFLLCPMTLVA